MTTMYSNQVAVILREIGSKKCIERANILDSEPSSAHSLHLRDLGLHSSDITSIVSCLSTQVNHTGKSIRSISFSYNTLLGDAGVLLLMKDLPKSICEVGLVRCGIGDIGGLEILDWMHASPQLKMICMEDNGFSEQLRSKIERFSDAHPHILVVY